MLAFWALYFNCCIYFQTFQHHCLCLYIHPSPILHVVCTLHPSPICFKNSLPYFSFLGGLAFLGLCSSSSNKSAMFQLFPLRFRGQTIFKRIMQLQLYKKQQNILGAAINSLHILSRCRIHSSSLTAFSLQSNLVVYS